MGRVAPARLGVGVVALVVAVGLLGARAFDERPAEDGGPYAELLGRAALAELPPGGVAFTSGDDTSGVLTYLLGVEGARPDAAHIALGHLYDAREIAHWHRLFGERVVPRAVVEEAERAERASELKQNAVQQRLLESLVGGLLGSEPMAWEPGIAELDRVVEPLLRPAFPLWRVQRGGAPSPYPLTAVPEARQRWALLAHEPPTRRADGALATVARDAALTEIRRGRQDLATALLVLAVHLDPTNHRALSNLSVLRERTGALDEALLLARRVVALRPDYHVGRRNLAGLLLRTGDVEGALAEAGAALTLARRPGHIASTHVLLARVALARDEVEAAREQLHEALRHAPGHREATALLRACCE
jgi:tetratricopeptide (TPR) repeat protein